MDHSIELQLMPDVLAAQQGDMAAYQRLINRCRQTVSSIALAIVKDLDRSEDDADSAAAQYASAAQPPAGAATSAGTAGRSTSSS